MPTRKQGRPARKTTLRNRSGLSHDAIVSRLAPLYKEIAYPERNEDSNFTYGEIEWSTLERIVCLVKQGGQKGVFYDCGCGRGKSVLYAALTKAFTNSVGIELVKERVDLANQALQALRATHPVKVDLLAKSFLDTTIDYKDASALFISNLCLDASITASLFEKLRKEIVPGTYVFCSKQPGSTEGFTHVATEQVEMSWTKTSSLYIFRKA